MGLEEARKPPHSMQVVDKCCHATPALLQVHIRSVGPGPWDSWTLELQEKGTLAWVPATGTVTTVSECAGGIAPGRSEARLPMPLALLLT